MGASANGSVPKPGKVNAGGQSIEGGSGTGGDGQMARDFLALSKEVTQALKNTGYLPDINGAGIARTESPSPSSSSSMSPVAGPSGIGEKEVVVGTSKEEKKGKGWMVSSAHWLLKGDRKKKEDIVVKSQAKGTGYSSYQNKGWDVKAWMAAQKETDKQIQLVLEKIASELKKLHSITTVQGRNLPPSGESDK